MQHNETREDFFCPTNNSLCWLDASFTRGNDFNGHSFTASKGRISGRHRENRWLKYSVRFQPQRICCVKTTVDDSISTGSFVLVAEKRGQNCHTINTCVSLRLSGPWGRIKQLLFVFFMLSLPKSQHHKLITIAD